MKSRVIILVYLLLGWAYTSAQTFSVEENKQISGRIGEQLIVSFSITNISDQPINIQVKRIEKNIGSSQKTWFCWNNECYDEEVRQLPLSKRIEPGQTITSFKSVLTAGLLEGYSQLKYIIFNKENPSETVEVTANYTVEGTDTEAFIYSSEDVVINDLYPNPITEFAIIKYSIKNKDAEVKIVIHSVLGSIMGEYNLQPLESEIKIQAEEFNPGIYFYTLYIDNDGVMTRKLIVRK
ncbi:MAG: T9SS type A sorting domain-containing protein [Cyclobacteriaceae bacterium]|nr:T9SS type A sorting domain-containing protein [Cyclobacteriaceae bacterium]